MYAHIASIYVRSYCKATFQDPDNMESTVCTGGFLDCFDIVGTGSHKYIPVKKLNKDLGLPNGAGVYNYAKFSDGSYLLYTCPGRVAYWSGKNEDPAKYPTDRTELVGMQFYLAVSDRHDEGTTYIYGPFKNASERGDFQVKYFPNGCGRLIHPINNMAFIKPERNKNEEIL